MQTLAATPTAAAHDRFCEVPPETLPVTVAELWERLPVEFRTEGELEEGDRLVELPCGEIFQGNTPRISLGVLQELIPARIHIPEGVERDRRIPLPPAWLATRYRLINQRVGVETPTEPPNTAIEEVINQAIAEVPPAEARREIKKPGFFSSLPTFYRHAPAAEEKAEEKREEKALSEEPVVVEQLSEMQDENPAEEVTKDEAAQEELATVSVPALERLWKMDPKDQFADPRPLQELFMTDEKPTLERVVALAGELPGLRACVLVHGERVLCSSTATTGMDLQSLSGQAMNLLSKIRESSAEMGLGCVPSITLHAEQGVLSFLYEGELCLLVLHADRAFVPGVRERLQQMLGHLSQAKALSGGVSSQPSLPN